MRWTFTRRVGAVGFLLGVLLGLCVWYGTLAPAPNLGAYPANDDVGPTPEAFVGGPVELHGDVVGTDPVEIELRYGDGRSRPLTITDLAIPVKRGEKLRVFGTLSDPNTVRATNAFTVPPRGLIYTYGISFLAGLWVLARLVSQWRFDIEHGLVRRTTPLEPFSRIRAWVHAVSGGRDA